MSPYLRNLSRHQAEGLAIVELRDDPNPRKTEHPFSAKELYLPVGYEVVITYELRRIPNPEMVYRVAEEAVSV